MNKVLKKAMEFQQYNIKKYVDASLIVLGAESHPDKDEC